MLEFDPGHIERFKAAIRQIPGYPAGEDLPIRDMIFSADGLERLPAALELAGARRDQPLLVVMDGTPMRRAEADLKPLVLAQLQSAGWQPQPVWLEPDATAQVHTDWPHIERVQADLRPGAAVLSVGSGTVTDIAKHASYQFQRAGGAGHVPFVAFATANSVSAYASNMAPVFVDGVKRTLPSRYPDVLVCDLETLRDAPAAMTVAGVGDLLAAFNSYADWHLAYRLGLDPSYTQFAQTLMGPLDDIFTTQAAAIRERTLDGMAVLAKLITLGGLAMSLSHATAPLSGYEHLVSHLLDLLAETAGRPLAQHGTQVALATILTAQAHRLFLESFEPAEVQLERCYPTAAEMQALILARLGPLDKDGRAAAECWADYAIKLEAWHEHRAEFEAFLGDWPIIRAEWQALVRPPESALAILRAVGSADDFERLAPPPGRDEVKFALLNAPFIRRRLTLGDLFVFLHWDPEALWQSVWAGRRGRGAP